MARVEAVDAEIGNIRINMRSTVLETFDGRDIVVPNEKFITSTFTDWTHKDKRQRYSIELQVAYDTDIPKLLDLVREVVRSHPQVLDGPDVPEDPGGDGVQTSLRMPARAAGTESRVRLG